jgi:hypothetical protein
MQGSALGSDEAHPSANVNADLVGTAGHLDIGTRHQRRGDARSSFDVTVSSRKRCSDSGDVGRFFPGCL